MKSRSDALRAIATRQFDVCVIGAGATGAGCALDSQLRGFQTVLVDAGDFASATSSASTKLVHGGVRYLQQAVADFDFGQLKVVREALRERILMLRNAPHLVHSLEFVVPCFSRFEVFYYGIGMKLYDWLAGKASLGNSRVLNKQEVLRLLPALKADRLAGGVSYLDGQFDDARYGVTLVKTFAGAEGEVANYLQIIGFEKDAKGKLVAAIAKDAFGGNRIAIRARVFVNATGPFSDNLRSLANPDAPARLVHSKGAHILLPMDRNGTDALLIPKTEDGRVIFAIPWLGRLLVGTTDQEVATADHPAVTREDATYLLRHLNRYSTRQYELEDIVAAFAGIRPLVKATHSRQTKKLAREHELEIDRHSGLISILGGKWTTYRVMAEHTVDAVATQLRQSARLTTTQHRELAGSAGYTPEYWRALAREYELSEPTARHLAEKFGVEAAAVLELTKDDTDLKLPIVDGAPPIRAEIVFCVHREMAVTIEDVLARRIGLQFFDWKLAIKAAPVVASHLARELAWDDSEESEATQLYVRKTEKWLAETRIPSN
jgi:glycerol-3-phosphate dehydrogenase